MYHSATSDPMIVNWEISLAEAIVTLPKEKLA